MILKRLFELAERENLLDDPSVGPAQVACVVNVGPDGQFLGVQDRRTPQPPQSGKAAKTATKPKLNKGKAIAAPRRPVVATGGEPPWKTTDPAVNGVEKPARFLADTIFRALPLHRLIEKGQEEKLAAQRKTFWAFVSYAAGQTKDPALEAMSRLGQRLGNDPATAEHLTAEVEKAGFGAGELCTFAWHPDQGKFILERPAVRSWWRHFYEEDAGLQQAELLRGFCQVTEQQDALADSIKPRINGLISIGCRADAYLVVGLGSAGSYGLSGAQSAMVSERAVDGYTRALNALITNSLSEQPRSSLRLGNVMFLFWTREPAPGFDPAALLEQADPMAVEALLRSPVKGDDAVAVREADFYCLALGGNSARVVVRDYLESTIPQARRNLSLWFRDLRIIGAANGESTGAFPLWQLAGATVRDSSELSPHVPPQLLSAALRREPLPHSVLAACLHRLQVEGAAGFGPARLGLVKLILNRSTLQGEPMSEALDRGRSNPAYVCGQLLAVFERLQWAALGDVNATVVDRFYGMASTSPGLVFPRLFKSAEQHLSKLHGEKPGFAENLQKDLEVASKGVDHFPTLLSLGDQGQFALGFYHRRADYRAASQEKRRERSAAAAVEAGNSTPA